jgi:hypothetical protein
LLTTSRIEAAAGNLNDRLNGGDSRAERRRPRIWYATDRLSSKMYVLADRVC